MSVCRSKAVCDGIAGGWRAVVGPDQSAASRTVSSICDGLDIPHFHTVVCIKTIRNSVEQPPNLDCGQVRKLRVSC